MNNIVLYGGPFQNVIHPILPHQHIEIGDIIHVTIIRKHKLIAQRESHQIIRGCYKTTQNHFTWEPATQNTAKELGKIISDLQTNE